MLRRSLFLALAITTLASPALTFAADRGNRPGYRWMEDRWDRDDKTKGHWAHVGDDADDRRDWRQDWSREHGNKTASSYRHNDNFTRNARMRDTTPSPRRHHKHKNH